ncbi:hypothetical protein PTSG_04847 [Salpingoeca rosetta]|uniref:GYF domain-containing protein n=1 Tax=Salpingoeca rosetta (strain ATCC 50818 / BSB-021) TaxID=946362 RepID=F2U9V7_SALR5|nr:uncharacterized protein PTSG_04847 [Salpingoeca rosetta]EGD73134.1 hypothetical protein PTSG_04847 [Salpingoeca rosetta]|eukprot:XP_004994165.1 hypothetical protein PTSG_04847 [Salpingoeca rosetta]
MADRRRKERGPPGGGAPTKRAKTQERRRQQQQGEGLDSTTVVVEEMLVQQQQEEGGGENTWDNISPEERSNALLRARERDTTGDAHTLESDEEDEEEKEPSNKYELTEEDMHEKTDEEFQNGGYTITGFNLEEEMEEGHFDEQGAFHFKKDEDHAGDAWLEGVEVYKGPVKEGEDDDGDDDGKEADIDRFKVMEEMLTYMREHETVNAAIRRLDAESKPSRQTFRQKKKEAAGSDTAGSAGGDEDKAKAAREKAGKDLTRLIELADQLMQDGVFTIYEDTYEKLVHEIKEKDVATFEYKWSEDEDAEVYGPFTAQQMADWQEAGFFKSGVWARQLKKGRNAKFYHSSRIDFDLYT